MDHEISPLEDAQRVKRQKIGIAGPGADQIDNAFPSPRSGGPVQEGEHGLGGAVVVSTQDGRRDGSVEDLLPQSSPRWLIPDHRLNRAPKTLSEARDRTEPRRQERLDPRAHLAGKARKFATARHRDDDGIPIDNRRHDERGGGIAAGPVDNIDGNATRPCRNRDCEIDIRFARRGEQQTGAIGIRRRERPQDVVDLSGCGEDPDLPACLRRHDGDLGTGGNQKADLRRCPGSAAYDNGPAPPDVKEDRQEFHSAAPIRVFIQN